MFFPQMNHRLEIMKYQKNAANVQVLIKQRPAFNTQNRMLDINHYNPTNNLF